MSVKTKKCEKTGKTKYQAVVWFDHEYYGAKTFDSRALAAGKLHSTARCFPFRSGTSRHR